MELQVITHNIGEEETQAVSARELHSFLGIKRDFSNWIKYYIKSYGFVEGQEFSTYSPKVANSFDKPKLEYALTLDCAKELSMVSRTPKSKEARKYFIEIEKEYKKTPHFEQLSEMQMISKMALEADAQNKRITAIEDDIKRLEKTVKREEDFITVAGYANLKGYKFTRSETQMIGKKATKLSKSLGIKMGKIPDQKWGEINIYDHGVLEEIVDEYTKEILN